MHEFYNKKQPLLMLDIIFLKIFQITSNALKETGWDIGKEIKFIDWIESLDSKSCNQQDKRIGLGMRYYKAFFHSTTFFIHLILFILLHTDRLLNSS